MGSHQHDRREFNSPEEAFEANARGLIEKAKKQSEKLGIPVDPITFAQREDDDINALRAVIAKEQGAVSRMEAKEVIELDPRLTTFKADFDKDATLQSKCSWAEIQTRLLANEGHYLALAQAMEGGGELFGADRDGNILFSDRGDEPIMKGMNYKDTRDRVLYKHDRYDKDGKMQTDEAGKPISTGYEMFPYSDKYAKSDEILQYEAHTGSPFVKSPNGDEWRSSWVESGENPSWPRNVYFNPDFGYANVNLGNPLDEFGLRGVRRLLRVKKA